MITTIDSEDYKNANNEYLYNILHPFGDISVGVPDFQRTRTVVKRTQYTATFLPTTTDFILAAFPQSEVSPVIMGSRVTHPSTGLGTIGWSSALAFDDDLSGYYGVRLVSFGLEMYSDTLAVGASDLKGNLQGAWFSGPVNFDRLDPQGMSPYSYDPLLTTDIITGLNLTHLPECPPDWIRKSVSFSNGIGSVHRMRETNTTTSTVNLAPAVGGAIMVWDASTDTSFPGGIRGTMACDVRLRATGATGAQPTVTLDVKLQYITSAGVFADIAAFVVKAGSVAAAGDSVFHWRDIVRSDYPVARVIISAAGTAATWPFAAVASYTLLLEIPKALGPTNDRPCYLLRGFGLDTTNAYFINMIGNYEAIPTFALAREVKGINRAADNMFDLETAYMVCASGKIKPWKTRAEYSAFTASTLDVVTSRRALAVGHAASFDHVWKKIKSVGRSAWANRGIAQAAAMAYNPALAPVVGGFEALVSGFDQSLASVPKLKRAFADSYEDGEYEFEQLLEEKVSESDRIPVFISTLAENKWTKFLMSRQAKLMVDETRHCVLLPPKFYAKYISLLTSARPASAMDDVKFSEMPSPSAVGMSKEEVMAQMRRYAAHFGIDPTELFPDAAVATSRSIVPTGSYTYSQIYKEYPAIMKNVQKKAIPYFQMQPAVKWIQSFPVVSDVLVDYASFVLADRAVYGSGDSPSAPREYEEVSGVYVDVQILRFDPDDTYRQLIVTMLQYQPLPGGKRWYLSLLKPYTIGTVDGRSAHLAMCALLLRLPSGLLLTGEVDPETLSVVPIKSFDAKFEWFLRDSTLFPLFISPKQHEKCSPPWGLLADAQLVGVVSVFELYAVAGFLGAAHVGAAISADIRMSEEVIDAAFANPEIEEAMRKSGVTKMRVLAGFRGGDKLSTADYNAFVGFKSFIASRKRKIEGKTALATNTARHEGYAEEARSLPSSTMGSLFRKFAIGLKTDAEPYTWIEDMAPGAFIDAYISETDEGVKRIKNRVIQGLDKASPPIKTQLEAEFATAGSDQASLKRMINVLLRIMQKYRAEMNAMKNSRPGAGTPVGKIQLRKKATAEAEVVDLSAYGL